MAILNRPSGTFSNNTGSHPRGQRALAIAAAVVLFGTAVWNGQTIWPTNEPDLVSRFSLLVALIASTAHRLTRAAAHNAGQPVEAMSAQRLRRRRNSIFHRLNNFA